jgi:hypothetical protein
LLVRIIITSLALMMPSGAVHPIIFRRRSCRPSRADIVAKVENCSALIFSSESVDTAIADKQGAKLVSEVTSEFVTRE